MARVLTVRNIYDKQYETVEIDGVWRDVLGEVEANGAWLIYGKEKNGKTWASLLLAWALSKNYRVLYISAEEGAGKALRDTLQRIGVDARANIHFMEYEELHEVRARLSKRKSPEVVIFDNLTIYNDELKGSALRQLLNDFDSKLLIFVAHEDRNEPYTASAKLVRKLAKVIIHVKGLACNISGRVPGGTLVIDEQKAMLYHGQSININNGKDQLPVRSDSKPAHNKR
jgi:hypothetical protein